MNIFGLQDIGETIKEFGTDEQLKEFFKIENLKLL